MSELGKREYDRLSMAERLAYKTRVDEVTGCWEWTGTTNHKGYGHFKNPQRRMIKVHRFAWEQIHGPLDPEITIDHLCHNRICVNPAHLEPVSREENGRRNQYYVR